jgi:hypothetical protein
MDQMFIVDGEELQKLIMELRGNGVAMGAKKLRIAIDGEHVKFKINERMWSPSMGRVQEPY